jgi:hypothetical protein
MSGIVHHSKETKMRQLCLVVVVGALSLSAADGPEATFSMKNGRFWNTLTTNNAYRPAFVIGLLDGWTLRGYTEDVIGGKVIVAMSGTGQFTTDDLAEMITSVYAETENLTLPVGWVVLGCLAVQRGEATRDLVFMTLRRHLSSLRASKEKLSNSDVDAVRVIMQLHQR